MTDKEVSSQSNDQAVDFLAINKPSLGPFLLWAQSSSQNSVLARESDLVLYRLQLDNDLTSPYEQALPWWAKNETTGRGVGKWSMRARLGPVLTSEETWFFTSIFHLVSLVEKGLWERRWNIFFQDNLLHYITWFLFFSVFCCTIKNVKS